MMGLILDEVCFGFHRRELLFDRFSWTFRAGCVTAVMGPSGCGKTTLLKLACGMFRPSVGQVRTGSGQPISTGLVRGVVFQDDTLMPWLTLHQNLRFHAPKSEELAIASRRTLASLGLSEWADRYPFELSEGMRKRVEFARALLADARYLLLDEPFSSLDEPTKTQLWSEWIGKPNRDARTWILTTHDPNEAARIADNVVVLTHTRPIRVQGVVESAVSSPVQDRTAQIRALMVKAAGTGE